eukprot:scaffold5184_cov39-Cyclotella_meneghiniana.AAC.2
MKDHIRDQCKFTLELVPPGCHRRNAAEVAIPNFKAHFLSVLACTVDNFPPSLWDKLLPQTEITLNLLRQSNATPTVSAYAHINGPFDYNKMPLAPMGCEVQVHEKTNKRGSWAYHSVDCWYLNTSLEHYRVHNCYIKNTKNTRLSDTVQFQHKSITNPEITPLDKLMRAIANCKAALQGLDGDKSNQQINELKQIVDNAQAKVTDQAQIPRVQATTPTQQQVPRVHNQQNQSLPRVQVTTTATATVKPAIAQSQVAHNRITRAAAQKSKNRRLRAAHTAPINCPNQPPAIKARAPTQQRLQNQPSRHMLHPPLQNQTPHAAANVSPDSNNLQKPPSNVISIKHYPHSSKVQRDARHSCNNSSKWNEKQRKH